MKNFITLTAGLILASTGAVAGTSNYYLVTPLNPIPSNAAPKDKIELLAATLPSGIQGVPYAGIDFKPKVRATHENFFVGDVTWRVIGTLPAGMTLSSDGVLQGIPVESFSGSVTLQASYEGKDGRRSYQLFVQPLKIELSDAELPVATWGVPYSVSLLEWASISHEGVSPSVLQWSMEDTAGLKLSSSGLLAGTVNGDTADITLNVSASYLGINASNTYQVPVTAAIKRFPEGYRAWSDGSYASNCAAYRNGEGVKRYAADTGDGIYRINTGSALVDVYCDMTKDGGGWMLVYSQIGSNTPFAARNKARVVPTESGSLSTMGAVFNVASEFRWTDTAGTRFMQGRTHMPTWYTKFTSQLCNTAGNTILVQFENGWANTGNGPRLVEACVTYPFGMRNNLEFATLRDIHNDNITHMCWFDDAALDRPFSGNHAGGTVSYCPQFNYSFPATATRGGTMDYLVWVR